MSAPLALFFAKRRSVLRAASFVGSGLAGTALAWLPRTAAADKAPAEAAELVERWTGRTAAESARVRLAMPATFGNGYTVPLTVEVDSPMTEADHVRMVTLLAPSNPIVVVASFQFTPRSGRAAIATRIRLAQTQTVIAVAAMSDGASLMALARVAVDTDGCS